MRFWLALVLVGVCGPVWADGTCLLYTAQCLQNKYGPKHEVTSNRVRVSAWAHACGDMHAWRNVESWDEPMQVDGRLYSAAPDRALLKAPLVCRFDLNGKPAQLETTWKPGPLVENSATGCAQTAQTGEAPRISVKLNGKVLARDVPLQVCRDYKGKTIATHMWTMQVEVMEGKTADVVEIILNQNENMDGPGNYKGFNLTKLLKSKRVPVPMDDVYLNEWAWKDQGEY